MRDTHYIVRWIVLLMLLGLLAACFARLRELGAAGTPGNSEVTALVTMNPVPISPIETATVSSGRPVTMTIVDFFPDVLGVVVDINNRVIDVEQHSAAAKAGIQVGDELDSVDGISFKDKQKAKDKISEPQKDKKLKLKFKRNDKTMEMDITPSVPDWPADVPTGTPIPTPQDYF
ncbi:MAG: PDZ domain-containing protein [Caldilineaceae bacterium]